MTSLAQLTRESRPRPYSGLYCVVSGVRHFILRTDVQEVENVLGKRAVSQLSSLVQINMNVADTTNKSHSSLLQSIDIITTYFANALDHVGAP